MWDVGFGLMWKHTHDKLDVDILQNVVNLEFVFSFILFLLFMLSLVLLT